MGGKKNHGHSLTATSLRPGSHGSSQAKYREIKISWAKKNTSGMLIYPGLPKGAKWFLKGVNSPSLKFYWHPLEGADIYIYISGQIIATSHDRFPPNGGLVREIPLLSFVQIYIYIYTLPKTKI